MQVTIYLVPVFAGQLVVFDVTLAQAKGRWLPWDVMDFGANPYEAASGLADDWCAGAVSDLALEDVLSLPLPQDGWELAIVFRAELTAKPEGDRSRIPALVARGSIDAIGPFDPVDLERWVAPGPDRASDPMPGGRGSSGTEPRHLF
jgi:hypothetical protein